MNIFAQSGVGLTGVLSIFKVMKGERHLVFEDTNLILKSSREKICQGLYQAGIQSDPIVSLAVGSGGTVDPEGRYAKIPTLSQTSLNTLVGSVSVTAVPGASGMEVTFLADLDDAQGNGQLISEASLVTAAGSLFNVKNFPGVPKTSEFSLHFEWTIYVG